jgi:hypothetical protein
MPIEGFGVCGICGHQIGDPPPPLRHYKGNVMAHKTCHDKQTAYEQTDDFRISQAESAVENARQKLEVAKYELEVAELKLKQAKAAVQ